MKVSYQEIKTTCQFGFLLFMFFIGKFLLSFLFSEMDYRLGLLLVFNEKPSLKDQKEVH